jgi:hypothetical protein
MFDCVFCEYSTNRSSNWNRHLASKFHILKTENITKNITNEEAVKLYISNESFKKDNRIMQNKIDLLELELKNCKEQLTKVEKQDEFHKDIIKESGKVISKSMNAITFLAGTSIKAPVLSTIADKEATDMLSQNEIVIQKTKLDPKHKKTHIAEHLLDHYRIETLCEYFRDIIIKAYKKENPKEQSFWSSDVQRLVYVIKDLIDDEDKWVYDKNGIKIRNRLINPIMLKVYDILEDYHSKTFPYISKNALNISKTEFDTKLSYCADAENLMISIKNRQLHKKLIKMLAPEFFLERKTKINEKGDLIIDVKKENNYNIDNSSDSSDNISNNSDNISNSSDNISNSRNNRDSDDNIVNNNKKIIKDNNKKTIKNKNIKIIKKNSKK